MFPGSSSDNQAGSASARYFVVGKRDVAQGADKKYYSRALQAYTTHYYQISGCVTTPLTGTFTTANIPVGNTFADNVPTVFPTVPDTKDYSVIDPLTAAQVKKFGVFSHYTNTPLLVDAGNDKICSDVAVSGGFYCTRKDNQGFWYLYWVSGTATGADGTPGTANFLGLLALDAGTDFQSSYGLVSPMGTWDSALANVWYTVASSTGSPAKPVILKVTYTGTTSNKAPGTFIKQGSGNLTVTNLTPLSGNNTLSDKLAAFDSNYQPTWFEANCGLTGIQLSGGHTYGLGKCLRNTQDSATSRCMAGPTQERGSRDFVGSAEVRCRLRRQLLRSRSARSAVVPPP